MSKKLTNEEIMCIITHGALELFIDPTVEGLAIANTKLSAGRLAVRAATAKTNLPGKQVSKEANKLAKRVQASAEKCTKSKK